MEYKPTKCRVCGKVFTPRRINQVTCGESECVKINRNRNKHQRTHHRKEPKITRAPNPDTIVAIGYADRQRQATLAMVGKIKVEL